MCFRNCPTDFMGVKSRGLLSLRTNLFLFFTNGGREHQTAQILRHAVSNHVIRTPYRDNRIQARRVQASGHPLGFCVAKSEQSKKTPRKFSKSRFPLASRYVFLSKPLREQPLQIRQVQNPLQDEGGDQGDGGWRTSVACSGINRRQLAL